MKIFNVELIQQFRKDKGWSIKQFCKECKISQRLYYKILNQQSNVSILVLDKLEDVIGESVLDKDFGEGKFIKFTK